MEKVLGDFSSQLWLQMDGPSLHALSHSLRWSEGPSKTGCFLQCLSQLPKRHLSFKLSWNMVSTVTARNLSLPRLLLLSGYSACYFNNFEGVEQVWVECTPAALHLDMSGWLAGSKTWAWLSLTEHHHPAQWFVLWVVENRKTITTWRSTHSGTKCIRTWLKKMREEEELLSTFSWIPQVPQGEQAPPQVVLSFGLRHIIGAH